MKGHFDGKGPKFRQIEVKKHRLKVCKMRLSHLRTRKQIQHINEERVDRVETGRPAHVKHVIRG